MPDQQVSTEGPSLDELEPAKEQHADVEKVGEADLWHVRYLAERHARVKAQLALLDEQRTRLELERADTEKEYAEFQQTLAATYGLRPKDRVLVPSGLIQRAPSAPSANGRAS